MKNPSTRNEIFKLCKFVHLYLVWKKFSFWGEIGQVSSFIFSLPFILLTTLDGATHFRPFISSLHLPTCAWPFLLQLFRWLKKKNKLKKTEKLICPFHGPNHLYSWLLVLVMDFETFQRPFLILATFR